MESPFREGKAPFQYVHLSEPAQTWYRVYGDITVSTPLVVLHGGPGFCHNYLLPLADLAPKRAVILYDQIGNGLSTHLPEKRGDQAFWTVDLFVAELENLLTHLDITGNFDLLGHSWGGMLGAEFAIRRPAGLRRLVLSNAPASVSLWLEAVNRLRATLPPEVQATLKRCEDEGQLDSKEYENATMAFLAQFSCRVDPWPQDFVDSIVWATETDSTVASTMLGPSEFWIEGNLKDWSVLDRLRTIQVPTMLINGKYDEAQDSAVEPFFWGIDKVKWITLSGSSHCPQFDERQEYLEVIDRFLASS
ncbi:proline-specific peptidase [Aspergillus homomorphus CBS 101889]|uniref:Proline-specific peptidase n=1 Tax=Aspergillus homomorphus (strain CBS 101889) TaxID=1450537 RepID=A0A395HLV6_ASPHC|nr:proline-specific peptidase [Aspergillus homomorphus CBS 101889]RAL08469.1 proline-specific peptidase [Aspergillus homomorphus CBS 101889]